MHGVKAPAKINFDAGVCDSQNTQYVGVFGEFGTRRLSSKKPVVKLVIDKENIPFKWTFHMGGVNGDSDTHSFTIGTFNWMLIKRQFRSSGPFIWKVLIVKVAITALL